MSELTVVQMNPDMAVELTRESQWYGWLFQKHPDGQYVSVRRLEGWEIMQAEDQRDEGIILNGNGTISKSNGARFG